MQLLKICLDLEKLFTAKNESQMLLHSYSTESAVINELMSLKELYKLTMHCSIGLHSSDLSTPQCWNLGDQFFYHSLEFLFIADFFFGNKWLLLAILPYIAGELWMWSVTAVASVQRQPWLQFHAAGCHFLLVLWSGCFDKKPYFMKWTVNSPTWHMNLKSVSMTFISVWKKSNS